MHDLLIILLSALPVVELRATLPLALEVYDFAVPRALVDVYLGNALPVVPLVFGLNTLVQFLSRRSRLISRLVDGYLARVRSRLEKTYQLYGALALLIFVAIPLPMTGVWTASAAAAIFGVKARLAIPAILAGMVISGLIVLAVTKGVVAGFGLI